MKKYLIITLLYAGCITVGCDKESSMDRPIGNKHLHGHLSPSIEQLTVDCNSHSLGIYFENAPDVRDISVFVFAEQPTTGDETNKTGPFMYENPEEGYLSQSDWHSLSYDEETKMLRLNVVENPTNMVRKFSIHYCALCEWIHIIQEPKPSANDTVDVYRETSVAHNGLIEDNYCSDIDLIIYN